VINSLLSKYLPPPFRISHLTVGNLEITVPWSSLGTKPVVVVLDKINVLITMDFTNDEGGDSEDEARKARREKLDSLLQDAPSSDPGFFSIRRWLGEEILNKVVETFQLHVRDVHVRLEDPSVQMGAGITLESLHVSDNRDDTDRDR